MKLLTLKLPEYILQEKYTARQLAQYARQLDYILAKNFNQHKIVLRTISSQAHKLSQKALLEHIKKTGVDRYDTAVKGNRYDNIEGKHIDFFGRTITVGPNKSMTKFLFKGFHWWVPKDNFQHMKMDVWLIYDRAKLKSVLHTDARDHRLKRDGYVFKDPKNKPEALIGIINIV